MVKYELDLEKFKNDLANKCSLNELLQVKQKLSVNLDSKVELREV